MTIIQPHEEQVLYSPAATNRIIEYLHSIEAKFSASLYVYQQFHEILVNFTKQRIDISGVVERLSAISTEERLLVYGLTPFLPPNHKIVCTSSGQFTVTTSTDAFNYRDICTSPSIQYIHGRVQRHGDFPVAGGAFADIWEGSFQNRKVAIKILRRFGVNAAKYSTRLWRECRTWGDLSHPNILPFLGVCLEHISETTLVPCFVSPWMDNGTVMNYILSHPNMNRLQLLLGIAKGIRYLHTRVPAVVHGDIRAGNILVSAHGTPLLSDFGLSRMLLETGGMTTSSSAGSSRWMSPELFSAAHVTTFSDIWAFGMTIIEISTSKPPYQEITNPVLVHQQIVKRKLPARPNGVSDDLWRIFLDCCAHKPTRRDTVSSIAEKLLKLSSPGTMHSSVGRGRLISGMQIPWISLGTPTTDNSEVPELPPMAFAHPLDNRFDSSEWTPIDEISLPEELHAEAKRISDDLWRMFLDHSSHRTPRRATVSALAEVPSELSSPSTMQQSSEHDKLPSGMQVPWTPMRSPITEDHELPPMTFA